MVAVELDAADCGFDQAACWRLLAERQPWHFLAAVDTEQDCRLDQATLSMAALLSHSCVPSTSGVEDLSLVEYLLPHLTAIDSC